MTYELGITYKLHPHRTLTLRFSFDKNKAKETLSPCRPLEGGAKNRTFFMTFLSFRFLRISKTSKLDREISHDIAFIPS